MYPKGDTILKTDKSKRKGLKRLKNVLHIND